MTDMKAFIAGMPKAELHMHIEGVLEPTQKFEMAKRNGLTLPYASVEDVEASYEFDDLPTFLDARYEGDTVLVTELDFYELGMAYFETVAKENGFELSERSDDYPHPRGQRMAFVQKRSV